MSIQKQSNEFFQKNGWVVLDNVLQSETTLILYHHLKMCAQKAKYVQEIEPDLFDDEQVHYGDFSDASNCLSNKVWNKYAEPVIETVLALATPMVQEHMGIKLVPTYSWSRMYTEGTEMKRHTDRDQCAVSGTLCLGYDNSNVDASIYPDWNWPMFIKEKNGEETPVHMKPGDMIIYRGCELEHWREPLWANNHAQVFLHYNEKDGEYDVPFDGRPLLGMTSKFRSEDAKDKNDKLSYDYEPTETNKEEIIRPKKIIY